MILRPCDGPLRTAGRMRRRSPVVLALLALLGAIACGDGPPQVLIATPLNGTFTTEASVVVSGVLLRVDLDSVADVRVNGVSALPLGPGGGFSVSVPLVPGVVIQPIVAIVIGNTGAKLTDRVTVIRGDSVADGDLSYDGIALRLTESGLDELEPLVTSLVPLDVASLVPPGTLVVDNFCYRDSIFGCLGRVDATVSGAPPPSISEFSIDIDPMTGFLAGDITLYDLFFRANVFAVTGIGFSCTLDVRADTTLITGDFDLSPDVGDANEVDVTQLGSVAVAFSSFDDSTNCSGLLGFIVEFFISVFIGDLQNDFVRPGLENFLNSLDAEGNTPIASAIETALEAIEIAGPIGEALGVDLEAPLFEIFQDAQGMTLGSDARITSTLPDPEAVDLSASYHVDQAFPTFGSLSPGGFPFDLGICISASAFNQLLKAEVESGLLLSTISELDLGSGPTTLTAGLLATLLPQFAALDPGELLQFEIRPKMAPIFTGEPGPAGEVATIRVPHLELMLVPVADPDVVLLAGVIDVTLGLDVGFSAGEIEFLLADPTPGSIAVTLVENPLFVPTTTLDALLPGLVALAVPVLADSLGSFPLPDFLGLQLSLVEADRSGEYTSLFFDMAPTP